MTRHVTFRAYGRYFKPSEINFTFLESADYETVVKVVVNTDHHIVSGGYIVMDAPRHVPEQDRIVFLIKTAQTLLPDLIRHGATEWELDIARYYSSQCNEEYTNEELSLMASINCPLNYSAYKVSKKEERELNKKYG